MFGIGARNPETGDKRSVQAPKIRNYGPTERNNEEESENGGHARGTRPRNPKTAARGANHGKELLKGTKDVLRTLRGGVSEKRIAGEAQRAREMG